MVPSDLPPDSEMPSIKQHVFLELRGRFRKDGFGLVFVPIKVMLLVELFAISKIPLQVFCLFCS